ncbi:MAG TPA: AraC family transcriptional regulator [Puia sp.]|jgi:AraC-like DNA-binding protein|nr:AraC family transcriptional regulator [Puia sp.]
MQGNPRDRQYLYRRIVAAKAFIDSHYRGVIDIDKMAGHACFSKFHFLRLFKQAYGMTPHQYVTIRRIGMAKEMLRDNHSVIRTCRAVGFESVSSFNRLFKRHSRQTPSEFAASARAVRARTADNPLDHVPLCYIEYLHWNK